MASSKKTSKLGLNLWTETDKPERDDFVQDNQKLEDLVGVHIKDTALHLTSTEKDWVKTPYKVFSFSGNGAASRVWNLDFEPKMIFFFATNRPDGMVENGLQSVFRAQKVSSFLTPGLTSSGKSMTITQQTEEEALASGRGYRLRLNESGVNYCGFIIK